MQFSELETIFNQIKLYLVKKVEHKILCAKFLSMSNLKSGERNRLVFKLDFIFFTIILKLLCQYLSLE